MATKKTRIQEQRIQNVSAPRAEPGAANTTIPRRDLLTGAALVLVGSASGCVATGGTAGTAGMQNLLRTKFMADFTAKFIGDPTKMKPPSTTPDPWPDPESGPSTRIWPRENQKANDVAN